MRYVYRNEKRSLFIVYILFALLIFLRIIQYLYFTQNKPYSIDPKSSSAVVAGCEESACLAAQRLGDNGQFITLKSIIYGFITREKSFFVSSQDRPTDSGIFAIKRALYQEKLELSKKSDSVCSWDGCLFALRELIHNSHKAMMNDFLKWDLSSLLLAFWYGSGEISGTYLQDVVRNVGLSHLFAPSGLHLGIGVSIIAFAFNNKFTRINLIVVRIIGTFFFCFYIGLLPSLFRAGTYSLISAFSQLFYRKLSSIYVLFLTIGLISLLKPDLLGSVSFQLSCAASFGVILVSRYTPAVSGLFLGESLQSQHSHSLKISGIKYVFESIIIGFAAQITTFPLVWYYFGSFQPLSLFFGLIYLWLMPFLLFIFYLSLFLLAVVTLFSWMQDFLHIYFFLMLSPVLRWIVWSLSLISDHFPLVNAEDLHAD